MATVSAIRDGIKARLATIDGLNTYDTAPDQVLAPAAVVIPGKPAVSYDSTMARGSDDYRFTIQLLVSKQIDHDAQDKLDGYLDASGATSVKAAVDGTLGGTVDFARVATADDYGLTEWNGITYLGARFTVEVTASA